jgi:fatty acid desaturase
VIPTKLNIALVLGSTAGCVVLLAWASHAQSWLSWLGAALLFSLLGNTVFSLLHEAVHGVLHPDRRWNEWLGRWLAAFFPTGLGFQRAVHLGHHRRNRSPVERFDWISPGESALLKVLQWYGLLLGFFWVLSPLACAAFLLAPRLLERAAGQLAEQTSASAMMEGLEPADRTTLRLEILGALLVQLGLFWAVGGTWQGWAVCYAAFALHWSSLQYADHAWSPLDVKEGAWNLRVPLLYRWVFLNYHLHLVHHRHPRLPWIHLPDHVDPSEPQPSFLAIYLRMWGGPRRHHGPG